MSVVNYHSLILLFFEKPENSLRFFFFISSSTTDESVEQTSSSTEIDGCSLMVFCFAACRGLIWLSKLVSECAVFGLEDVKSTGFTWMSCEQDRTIAVGLDAFTVMLLLLMLRLFGGGHENLLFLANVSSSLKRKMLPRTIF